jgi:hypothetical protein
LPSSTFAASSVTFFRLGFSKQTDAMRDANDAWFAIRNAYIRYPPTLEEAAREACGDHPKPLMFPSVVRRRSKPVPFGEIAYPEAHRQSPQRFSGSRVEMRTAARR